MKNLAGDVSCDHDILQELQTAGIQPVMNKELVRGEVPALITGFLKGQGGNDFTFCRAWYYWVVSGSVPLDVAEEMYADPGLN